MSNFESWGIFELFIHLLLAVLRDYTCLGARGVAPGDVQGNHAVPGTEPGSFAGKARTPVHCSLFGPYLY